MVCIGTPSLCLKKVIIAAAHIPQPPVDGNADLTAMDLLVQQMEEQKKRVPKPLGEPVHKQIAPVLIRRNTTK